MMLASSIRNNVPEGQGDTAGAFDFGAVDGVEFLMIKILIHFCGIDTVHSGKNRT